MDPYACCYCGVTKQTQKQIVEHTIQEYPTNEVKLRKCELGFISSISEINIKTEIIIQEDVR